MAATKFHLAPLAIALTLSACQAVDTGDLLKKSSSLFSKTSDSESQAEQTSSSTSAEGDEAAVKSLADILGGSSASVSTSKGFKAALASAVTSDPGIMAAADEVDALEAQVDITMAGKDIQVTGSLYGGVEDVTDETSGVAAVLNATRLVFDGGKTDAQIEASRQRALAARYALQAKMDERANSVAGIWADLEKYRALSKLISTRLEILDPLIKQLEQVADAGVGDVTQVSAAQRTVSAIRVEQTDVAERLRQAELQFLNAFGELPKQNSFDKDFISGKIPSRITDDMIKSAPALNSGYATYLAAEADLASVKAKDSVNIAFEAKASRPFGGSEFDSKESIGLVLTKSFFDKDRLKAEEAQAEARVEGVIARIHSLYRNGERLVSSAQQTVKSMDKAISLARKNAETSREEIKYLRRQLIVGGSSLDSVLSAEARLYDAESMEIGFATDRLKAQVSILSALGQLSSSLGLNTMSDQSN